VEIFIKHTFCGNFQRKQMVVYLSPKSYFWWKFAMQKFLCGNFPKKQINGDTFPTSVFFGNFPIKQGFVEMF
jgi:hypothetical protein